VTPSNRDPINQMRQPIASTALARTVQDKEFIAESLRRGLEVEPLPPDGILQIVADDQNMPADVVERLRAIMEQEK